MIRSKKFLDKQKKKREAALSSPAHSRSSKQAEKGKELFSLVICPEDEETLSAEREIIAVRPPQVIFDGFDISKRNITKIQIQNVSGGVERINIIPPTSPMFNIRMKRVVKLQPDQTLEIFIHFIPNQYKNYKDILRIQTEEGQRVVQIKAFPVFTRKPHSQIFPSRIDFGRVAQGEQKTLQYPLECSIPKNFQFQFVGLKTEHPFAISPVKGVIPGLGRTLVQVRYRAESESAAVGTVYLRVNSHGFRPLKIKLTANSQNPPPPSRSADPQAPGKGAPEQGGQEPDRSRPPSGVSGQGSDPKAGSGTA